MKFLHRILPAVLILTLGLLACARNADSTSRLSPGDHTRTLTHDGIQRSYILHVPVLFNPGQSAALVLIFHGGGATRRTPSA